MNRSDQILVVVVGVVVIAVEAPDDKGGVSTLSELEDTLYEDKFLDSGLVFAAGPRTLRSMKSDIKPGFVIFLS